ncbi:aminotransferase class V-fold PLP-dependent enzyme [Vibrio sp. TMPB1044]|uniref:aminotransferase class V-fold PLP-dependent enzyme n=1 Tax=Vibrio sp. TMPB1044 TaxID=3051822 RepID=UPI00255B7C71|nr:aminotransferase class V-fold PLP-dependent enzyme [Vibrio sp. TMPB1044]MDL5029126.1 aminotransferase class V-fold PLP-dependent enzyme [Vibrio sp. TMPB1044]MDN5209254.1 aminotransferase class V-fold PLP-dependent enzyme [Vibrio sp. TMPB1044]
MLDGQGICYMDNASTSYPKPNLVHERISFHTKYGCGSFNRSAFDVTDQANSIPDVTRGLLSDLIKCKPEEIYFTSGATESLNYLIFGFLNKGDHVIISPWEHNSVTRPLNFLKEERDISVTTCHASLQSGFDTQQISELLQKNTRLVIINHVSNVLGIESPLAEIGVIAKHHPESIFAVDASQSIGSIPIDVSQSHIDFLAFPGHKSLLGPSGIGGFYLSHQCKSRLKPIKFGGTGIKSIEPVMVEEGPHKFEVGTPNMLGIVGLRGALEHLSAKGIRAIEDHIKSLTRYLIDRLEGMDHVVTYLPGSCTPHGVVTINVPPLSPKDLSLILLQDFNIITRDGFHCAVSAHKIANSYPQGSVRISIGTMTTTEDVDYFCDSLELIK